MTPVERGELEIIADRLQRIAGRVDLLLTICGMTLALACIILALVAVRWPL